MTKSVITVTDSGGFCIFRVILDGHAVVNKSRFGIISDGVDLGAEELGKTSSRKINESYAILGAHAKAQNNCRETTITFPQR